MIALLWILACSTPKAPADTSNGGSPPAETAHTTDTNGSGPAMSHEAPTGGTMCFDCHLCANDDAPAVEVTHPVCVSCHKGPDGSVPDEVQSGCGCGALDCSTSPPTLGCESCHVESGDNGYPSSGHMNELCLACHPHSQ